MMKYGLLLLILGMSAAFSAESGLKWTTDYEVAVKQAKENKKKLFILFTNSTRCRPCKILKDTILADKAFKTYADKNLILLMVDYEPYFRVKDKQSLQDIEKAKKVPLKMGARGRGPWPYLFVLDSNAKTLYSGKAYEKSRTETKAFINFLKAL